MLRICVLSLLLSVSAAQFSFLGNLFTCRRYQHADCNTYGESKECGSNGVTYRNRCALTQARCQDSSIDVLYFAECDNRNTTGGPVLTGEQAVLDFFCLELSHEDCPPEKDEICATDRTTYDNFCEYEKQKCTHRELEVITFGQCPTVEN